MFCTGFDVEKISKLQARNGPSLAHLERRRAFELIYVFISFRIELDLM